jgi:hypothetical protein
MILSELRERLLSSWDLTAAESRDLLIPVCEALRERQVVSVEASYSGYGDSGAVEQVCYRPEGVAVPREVGAVVELWILATLPSGWEDNEGGEGTVTIDVVAGTAVVEHGQHVQETDWETFEIGGEEP